MLVVRTNCRTVGRTVTGLPKFLRWMDYQIDHFRNTITYHNALCLLPQNFAYAICLQFLLEVKMAPRETENNAYAKFWGDKQRALWYVVVFSGMVNFLRYGAPRARIELRR